MKLSPILSKIAVVLMIVVAIGILIYLTIPDKSKEVIGDVIENAIEDNPPKLTNKAKTGHWEVVLYDGNGSIVDTIYTWDGVKYAPNGALEILPKGQIHPITTTLQYKIEFK